MTITVSVLNMPDSSRDIRVFAFQDEPQFRPTGGTVDLHRHEVLELLERAGLTHEEGERFLEDVVRHPPRVHRRRFNLSPEQLESLQRFAPDLIEPLNR
jgi:hypothetical protein